MSQMTIRIEATGNFRSGISAKGNEYNMCEAFAHIPGIPYPQRFEYYAGKSTEILQVGQYECDITCAVKDNRLSFDADPRQARRINSAPVQAAKTA